ncbi:DUF1566 domain-containing protein [Oceanidesulfovibrio indonesiensis]|uniref:DUF1566 domain-containing protein n=1 Tax=Oceanidesulfovibrio indonesiensis TaxID=54767 RepID=A0A7M3MJ32_9BACT|nr:DUF1566 domain-containing protein [Oceanidesulfovibrio indonesiensis]TVM19785.1 DUF1566 domain-containing protein [Oceanidesulfovibrio indonesiensis]
MDSRLLTPLATGLDRCHDATGREMACEDTGQDAAYGLGRRVQGPRFRVNVMDGEVVEDRLTGLVWTRDASQGGFPLPWREALDLVTQLNADSAYGRTDWRLPNRRELRSLVNHGQRKPVLDADHPFTAVFQNWYWTSTTAAKATGYAWRVHMAGGRMFYGGKDDEAMVWAVAGQSQAIPQTGQRECYDERGRAMDCEGTGQDGALRMGVAWPEERFTVLVDDDTAVLDRLTGLLWRVNADECGRLTTWKEALDTATRAGQSPAGPWRLPNINELESLVDCSMHDPALPAGHPFENTQEAYWSSTSSAFEPDWTFNLYLHKGAVGVGYKAKAEFSCWLCAGPVAE